MGLSRVLLICVLILASVCVVLLAFVFKYKKAFVNLSGSVDKFFQTGKPTEISTSSFAFAELQNNICELENRLLSEREHTSIQIKNNIAFISDISHQLKTPLAGLRLYCEMDNNNPNNIHAQKQLELIDKMEKLIFNILKLEKLRGETYEMKFEENELSDVLNELKSEFLPIFKGRTITVIGNARFRFDKVWLKEAIGNVIKNACEHTEQGTGKIKVEIEKSERCVSVCVSDNGDGVPEEELSVLFNRFRKSGNASPKSSGLGLAITKAIVENYHGLVTAKNSESGLLVEMSFPIIDANQKI